jgi:hypothetical protein
MSQHLQFASFVEFHWLFPLIGHRMGRSACMVPNLEFVLPIRRLSYANGERAPFTSNNTLYE